MNIEQRWAKFLELAIDAPEEYKDEECCCGQCSSQDEIVSKYKVFVAGPFNADTFDDDIDNDILGFIAEQYDVDPDDLDLLAYDVDVDDIAPLISLI